MQETDRTAELEQLLARSITPAEVLEQVRMVLENDHAAYDELHRRVILAASGELERAARDAGMTAAAEPYPRVAVADALRDWIRDTAPGLVCDAAEPMLKGEWRRERERERAAGENVANRPEWRSWEDSIPNALSMLVRQIAGYALSIVDWRAFAIGQLESDLSGVTLEQLAHAHAAIRRAETGPDADPTGTGAPAYIVGQLLELEPEELADRVHRLSELGLAGDRFVGGTSQTLLHTRR
jgi:hypothetical protein